MICPFQTGELSNTCMHRNKFELYRDSCLEITEGLFYSPAAIDGLCVENFWISFQGCNFYSERAFEAKTTNLAISTKIHMNSQADT